MMVSVIIVNYNTYQTTKECIDSIFEYSKDIEFEVILVDNASTDNSRELSKDKRIVYIQSEENLGFGRANNLGYKYAKGDYIFLLNPDTLLLNNAIKLFYDGMCKMGDDVACLGAYLKAADGVSRNHSYGKFLSIRGMLNFFCKTYLRINRYEEDELLVPISDNPLDVEYIIGADLFIRKSVIDRLGLFDSDFFMYFEETEMQYRYKINGYKSIIIPTPQIIHLECVSTGGKVSQRSRMLYFNGMFVYLKKRYKSCKYVISRLLCLLYLPLILKRKYTVNENSQLLKLFLS